MPAKYNRSNQNGDDDVETGPIEYLEAANVQDLLIGLDFTIGKNNCTY
jgi:hypothetical protein